MLRLRTCAIRTGALLATTVAVSLLHVTGRARTTCLLRMLCGVPCPLCGGTTAAVAVGRADLLGALRASPLAVLGALAFVAAPSLPRPTLRSRQLWIVIAVVAVAAEVWQLFRFGTI